MERQERKNWTVAVYDVSLNFGGREEGGWWYDAGQLVRVVKLSKNEDAAYQHAARLNRKLRNTQWGPNQGRREKSSVLSDGFFEAVVFENTAPESFPETRPIYQ